jgi:signal transduction histidine kinase
MGARTLEAALRQRLLLFAGPIILVVAVVSLAAMSHALDDVAEDAARDRAHAALALLRDELAEGDDFATAVGEVQSGAASGGTAVVFRVAGDSGKPWPPDLPAGFATLAPGACSFATSQSDHAFCACAAQDRDIVAIAAIRTDAHGEALRTALVWVSVALLASMLAFAIAARRAVRGPLAQLERLVTWSQRVATAERERPPEADIAEIATLTRSLDDLVEKLFEALARERASSAYIAHELRTPLTAMRSELERMVPQPEAQRALDDVDNLAAAIDAILVLSNPSALAQTDTITNVADAVRALAPPGAEVRAPDEALIAAEPSLVQLALRNLLVNAEIHGGEPASTLRVGRDGDSVVVAVTDRGRGASVEDCARMFDRHWRSTEPKSGSGLGLALVRVIAEKLGGRAWAEPNADGPGLTVSFTLGPLAGWHD